MNLEWSGASGALVEIWRNDELLVGSANDGDFSDSVIPVRTYRYPICEIETPRLRGGRALFSSTTAGGPPLRA